MKNILTDEMLKEIFQTLEKGEEFTYEDENITMNIGPSGISIHYSEDNKTKEIEKFLEYCNNLDDELFVEVCESFEPGELAKLETELDTKYYKHTIDKFTNTVKRIASEKFEKIISESNLKLKQQEEIINKAKQRIVEIHNELETASKKYSV